MYGQQKEVLNGNRQRKEDLVHQPSASMGINRVLKLGLIVGFFSLSIISLRLPEEKGPTR